jgi:hypothetical protein
MFCTCQNTREGAGIIGFGTLASYNFRLIIEGLSVFWKQLGKWRTWLSTSLLFQSKAMPLSSLFPLLAFEALTCSSPGWRLCHMIHHRGRKNMKNRIKPPARNPNAAKMQLTD